MRCCEICHKPTGTVAILCLSGKFNGNGDFIADDVDGVICDTCWEDISSRVDTITIGGQRIRIT